MRDVLEKVFKIGTFEPALKYQSVLAFHELSFPKNRY